MSRAHLLMLAAFVVCVLQAFPAWAANINYQTPSIGGVSNLSVGTGLLFSGNSTNPVISFDVPWGDARYLQNFTESDPVFVANNASLWAGIDSKLNITDQRYNDTALIFSQLMNYYNSSEANNTFYPLYDNPAGYLMNETDPFYTADEPYIFQNFTDLWNNISFLQATDLALYGTLWAVYNMTVAVNDSLVAEIQSRLGNDTFLSTRIDDLNATKLNITDQRYNDTIRPQSWTTNFTASAGAGTVTTNLSGYAVTEIIVTPANNSTTYYFSAEDDGGVIDRSRIIHAGQWDIFKYAVINGTFQANVSSASVDDSFVITVKYLNNAGPGP